MHTFEAETACSHCAKLLKGLFYQGYRCHKCAKPMHKQCIAALTKCGTTNIPLPPNLPDLPARPLSMLHRLSSCSLGADNGVMSSSGAANPDYINTNIEEHSW
jgi:hypothetical protein